MSRIRFFVTGKTEEALPEAFQRIFPEGTFTVQRVEGFTSCALDASRPTERAQETLGDLVGAVQRKGGADYAILIDDLELANVGRAAEVAAYFRAAASSLVAEKSKPTVERLRDHVSVHLIAPMIEAYYFCDPNALAAAGVSNQPRVLPGRPEQFQTDDVGFLRPATSADRSWQHSLRCVHPKHYLAYLCEQVGTHYTETREGRAALEALDFRTAWQRTDAVWSLLGALIDDVADMLDTNSPTPSFGGAPTAGPGTVLRNL